MGAGQCKTFIHVQVKNFILEVAIQYQNEDEIIIDLQFTQKQETVSCAGRKFRLIHIITLYHHGEQKSMSEHTSIHEVDELHQQQNIPGNTLVAQEQESEAVMGTGSPKVTLELAVCENLRSTFYLNHSSSESQRSDFSSFSCLM